MTNKKDCYEVCSQKITKFVALTKEKTTYGIAIFSIAKK